MEPQTELMLNIQKICKEKIRIPVVLRELPKEGGLYAELGPGATSKQYIRSKIALHNIPVLFMCKMPEEPECIDTLSKVCNYWKSCRRIPDSKTYRSRGVSVASEVHKTGNAGDGQAVYSCIVNFKLDY